MPIRQPKNKQIRKIETKITIHTNKKELIMK